jgi:hypothetical protein
MSLAVITINAQSPALEHKSSEAALIAQALHIAATNIQSQQGTVTSGNIVGNGGAVIGSWTFTSQNGSPS